MINTAILACVLPLLVPGGDRIEGVASTIEPQAVSSPSRVSEPSTTTAIPANLGSRIRPLQESDASPPDEPLRWWDFANTRDALSPSRFGLTFGGGLGMIDAGSPYTLRNGELAAGINLMNWDRNPGDVDIVEGTLQLALGLFDRAEVFVRFSPKLRTNSVGMDPLNWPIPPLDLFVDTYPSAAVRNEPYFLYAQEFPYKTYPYLTTNIDPPGNGAFATSSGDTVLGFKVNVSSEDRGDWGGFGIRAYLEMPTETPGYNSLETWKKRAGVSGKNDAGVDLLFAKKAGEAEILVNLGYRYTGNPDRGLRVQRVNSGATEFEDFLVGEPIESGLDLRDEIDFIFGATFPLFEFPRQKGELWFIGEFSYTRYIGAGTPTERLVHPAEMRLGLQYNPPFARSLSFGFAWQLLFNDAGDGDTRVTSFSTPDGRGDINFGDVVDPDLGREVEQYFLERGATFSENSAKLFSTNNPAFDGWRNVSTAPQTIVGQGGGAALFYMTFRFTQLW